MIAILITMIALCFLLKFNHKKVYGLSMLLFVIFSLGILFLIFTGRTQTLSRFLQIPLISSNASYVENPESRIKLQKAAFQMFIENPIVGVGTGNYGKQAVEKINLPWYLQVRYLYDLNSKEYPHNIFLEIASENGLVGLLLLVLVIIRTTEMLGLVVKSYKNKSIEQKIMIEIIFSILIYGFIVAQTSLDLPRQYVLWWGVALVSSLYSVETRAEKEIL
jgi:O-antigen ligase